MSHDKGERMIKNEKPDVNRGELGDTNPSHGGWARVGKDIRLRCNRHLGFMSSAML